MVIADIFAFLASSALLIIRDSRIFLKEFLLIFYPANRFGFMVELGLKVLLFLGMQKSCRVAKLQPIAMIHVVYQIVIAMIAEEWLF
jgi:hypothetical protein